MIRVEQQRDLVCQIMSVISETGDRSDKTADFREQMLIHNHIDGMLQFEVIREENEKRYEFDIAGKRTLSEFFSVNKPDGVTLARILKNLLETVYRGREYMLQEDDYIIGADTVFIDGNEKVYTAYYPGYGEDLKIQMKDLAEYLMGVVNYSDEEAVMMVYGFYMRTKENNCTLEDLIKGLQTGKNSEGKMQKNVNLQKPAAEPHIPETVKQHIPETYQSHGVSKVIQPDRSELRPDDSCKAIKPDVSAVFSESPSKIKIAGFILPILSVLLIFAIMKTGILRNPESGRVEVIKAGLVIFAIAGICYEAEKIMWRSFAGKLSKRLSEAAKSAEEVTVFLYGNDNAAYPFSLVSDDQPSINVSHFPFFVGKDPAHCDYVMATQIGISRYHMKIDREGEDFTISDLNSTNGTYINGERLAPHLPRKVKRGDELKIGKCIYYCN